MQSIKAESVFGNYQWSAEVEVTPAQLITLAGLGLLQVMQRGPSTAAEKALAGYEKRPTGFKRDSIGYTKDGEAVLTKNLSTIEVKGEGDEKFKLEPAVVVGEYVPTTSEPKFAREKKIVAGKTTITQLSALATKVSFEYEEDTELTSENVEFLQAIKGYVDGLTAAI